MAEQAAVVYRGTAIEATHFASIAVINHEGNLTHWLGDPEEVVAARSSVKPFQALPLVRTGGFDHFGFNSRQLAITCASHSGTDEHRDLVASILSAAGNKPEHLKCGYHLPIYKVTEGLPPEGGDYLDPLRHNCSGKHAGFLALSRFLNEPVQEYINPDGKVQSLVKAAVGELCEYNVAKIQVGIDGCSAPVFALPLINFARGFKNLVTGNGNDLTTTDALTRISAAMREYPFLVSGHGRQDYDFMRSFPGNAITKIGAEALEVMAFRDPTMAICVKISDGGERALGPVCVHVLSQLGLIDQPEAFPYLARYCKPEVRNVRGLVTGRIVVDFKLRTA